MTAAHPSAEPPPEQPGGPRGSELVDWSFAAAAGRRIVPPGPKVTRDELHDLVAELRTAASQAREPVATTSGLHAPADAAAPLVVDRGGWIEANVSSMQALVGPVLDSVVSRRQTAKPVSENAQRWGGAVTGTEVAGLLAWVSTKVLGQYDLAPGRTPRLLLVAPNVLNVERELELVPSDFRLWVCLHEETHRVQFTAVPWLREHLIAAARDLGDNLLPEPEEMGQRLAQIVSSLPGVLRGETDITQVLATPEQREKLARVTAVMSLLEGHADVVMDDVGPKVVPSVKAIRSRFNERRKGAGSVDKVLRRLLGLEAKMRQYRDGAVFVREVTRRVGRDGFNAVWTSPETLPRPAEIPEPAAWVRRVHG
jgi:coenzyme F420 biosynthesis associated uncharacterized protein